MLTSVEFEPPKFDPKIPELLNKNTDSDEEKIFNYFYEMSPFLFERMYFNWIEACEEVRKEEEQKKLKDENKNEEKKIEEIVLPKEEEENPKNEEEKNDSVYDLFIKRIIPLFVDTEKQNLIQQFVSLLNFFTPDFCKFTNNGTLDCALEDAYKESYSVIYALATCEEGPISDKYKQIWKIDFDKKQYKCYTILKSK